MTEKKKSGNQGISEYEVASYYATDVNCAARNKGVQSAQVVQHSIAL